MAKWWKLVALGVAFFLIALIATFPAQYAYAFVKKKIAPDAPLMLGEVQGTLWSGRAAPAMIGGQRVDSLAWTIQPWALLIGRVQAHVEFRNGDSYGDGTIGRGFTGKLYAKNLQAHIALQRMRLFAQVLPVGMEGALLLNLKEFSLDKKTLLAGDGVLAWDGAIINSPARVNLGNLRAVLTTANDTVKATFADGGGPLALDGVFEVTREGNYKFNASLAARDVNERALAQWLQVLGRPGADGKVTVTNSGSLASLSSYFEKTAASPAPGK